MNVDLTQLPAPDIIETLSFEAILESRVVDLIDRYPVIYDTIQLESEPARKLLEEAAFRELILRARYNDEARALLLAFAKGSNLDHIGVTYYGAARLIVTPENTYTVPPTPAVMEEDSDYRYRLSLAPEGYSTAGPTGAYEYHARSADGQVKDVKVISPQRGSTEVFILSRTGSGVPSAELLATVDAVLNDETIRPLSEEVIITPASIVDYTLDIGLIMFQGAAGEVALTAAEEALATFADNSHRLKRDIIHSAIDAAAHQPGVKRVIIKSPPDNIVCTASTAPWCTDINVTIDGVET